MDAQKIKILLVDDQLENSRFLSDILKHQNYQVQSVIFGELAINIAFASLPDLLLLNVLILEKGGYELYQRWKTNEQTQDIPIIFFGILDNLPEKFNLLDLDNIDYINQPFQTQEVLLCVQNQLTLQRLKKQLKEKNAQLQQEIKNS